MKDKEKAKEVAEKQREKVYVGWIDIYPFVYDACLEMADWKEQQIIKWLKEHINNYIVKGRDIDLMFEDLKQAL